MPSAARWLARWMKSPREAVLRLLPRAYCHGRWDRNVGTTVYLVSSGHRVIGAGLSAPQAWEAAATLLDQAPGLDEGERYVKGRDVQELIGAELRKQGRS